MVKNSKKLHTTHTLTFPIYAVKKLDQWLWKLENSSVLIFFYLLPIDNVATFACSLFCLFFFFLRILRGHIPPNL